MQQHGSKYLARRHHHPQPWNQKVEIQFFQNMAKLHIKLKGIMHAATW